MWTALSLSSATNIGGSEISDNDHRRALSRVTLTRIIKATAPVSDRRWAEIPSRNSRAKNQKSKIKNGPCHYRTPYQRVNSEGNVSYEQGTNLG